MKLNMVYARFYKSFNFNHHRKAHEEAKAQPWEMIGTDWYPYIEIPIHDRITTVVGANESGKSHLLDAIEKAISGQGFRHQDLCRYCNFFNVEKGNDFWPHLGVGWTNITKEDVTKIRQEVDNNAPEHFDCFLMFREGPDVLNLYFPSGEGGFTHHNLQKEQARNFGKAFLPRPFRIHSKVALPGALPVSEITTSNGKYRSRAQRKELIEVGETVWGGWTGNADAFSKSLPQLGSQLVSVLSALDASNYQNSKDQQLSFDLARKLLIHLANH